MVEASNERSPGSPGRIGQESRQAGVEECPAPTRLRGVARVGGEGGDGGSPEGTVFRL